MTTSLNHRDIYFRVHGNFPVMGQPTPLVLLHGLMGYASNWGKVWPHFQGSRNVLVYDQRGHGRSGKPETGYAPVDYAQDLKIMLDHLKWERVHVVGHSMGGRVAMYFTRLYPAMVASLTLEDSGAEANPNRVFWIEKLLSNIPTPFPSAQEAKSYFEQHYRAEPLLGSFLHSNLVMKPSGQMDWRFHPPGMIETIQKGRALDAMPVFKAIEKPTLLVRGGKSSEFPEAEAERMAQARKDVKLETIPWAGHFVHSEAPKEFCEILDTFIRSHEN